MRYFRYAFLAALGVVLITVAVANRGMVTLTVLPEPLAEVLNVNFSIQLPLFAVIFGGIVAGLLIGFVWEWLREHKHRATAVRKEREVHDLQRKLKREQRKAVETGQQDEVLALLDSKS
ncbi:lipopolysaccharide assembly protein LapA domain-containing protein [Thalassovita sp.]|jgi:phosphotransferase system  glucose/maltose/N-acetylglucosamine-specific IIC component|uniref:lipopolysaccharide assembly protein LapA domain-containing protein n=1 Tax=Thalassovita sp. TaxID=1979401 RepID=UPI003B5914D5